MVDYVGGAFYHKIMSANFDVNLDILLEMALEESHSEMEVERAFVREMLPLISSQLRDGSADPIYSRTLSGSTIARFRHEALEIDRKLREYFENIPSYTRGNIYIWDYDNSKRYLTSSELEDVFDHMRSYLLIGKLIPLYNISNELAKIRTAQLVSYELLDPRFGGETGTNWILENEPVSAKHRPELLRKCGIIEDELVDDIQTITDFRNTLIHELDEMAKLDDPEMLQSEMESCIQTIERLDELVKFPSHVRLYEEKDLDETLGIDIQRLKNEIDTNDFEEVSEEVGDKLLRQGIQDEGSYMHRIISSELEDDEKLIGNINEFWNQHLTDIDDEEELVNELAIYGGTYARHFGINLFRRLKPYKDEFQSRFPQKVFSDDFIEVFDHVEKE